ncbi:MAG: metallophosphoesterase [Ignavibacteriae bacterium]|nr:metallophosphoesterase [Ignavibacteria bacterium]MBI3364610.1 metallophosphoesterase [Ignavibacteriota bacterium]
MRFAAIGDYGHDGKPENDVANLVKSWNPEFVITLGDNNYPLGADSTIDRNIGKYYQEYIAPYKGIYGRGGIVNQFFPCLGNHDWYTPGARPYFDYFTLPGNERYYDIVKGPVHLFALDSDPHEPDGDSATSVQANWLRTKLTGATEPWKIIYFHHPPYNSGVTPDPPTKLNWPFKQWGASAILAGHEHVYERLIENGLVYFVNGVGGEDLMPFGVVDTGSQVRYNHDFGAMLIEANNDSITFKFVTRKDSLKDYYSLLRSSPHH